MGEIQSDTMSHFLPSHCWMRTGPFPSWSSHVTLMGDMKPFMPSSSKRLSVRARFSKPQRTCSLVGAVLLPYFTSAVRMASADSIALAMPRL
jgi:hypothetical protein